MRHVFDSTVPVLVQSWTPAPQRTWPLGSMHPSNASSRASRACQRRPNIDPFSTGDFSTRGQFSYDADKASLTCAITDQPHLLHWWLVSRCRVSQLPYLGRTQ